MNDFPEFMRNPINAIDPKSQSPGNVGYVYDGVDGSQMAIWTSTKDVISKEHVHPVSNDTRSSAVPTTEGLAPRIIPAGFDALLGLLTGFTTMTNISS